MSGLLDPSTMAPTQIAYDALDARKTALLRPAYARLGMRNSQPFDWLAIGDSTTEGARCTNWSTRWATRALLQLRARTGQAAAGGYGYVPAWYSTGDQQTPSPAQFSSTGTDTGSGNSRSYYGLGRRCLALNGTGPGGPDKVTLTVTAGTSTASTSVDVMYAKTSNATSTLDIYLDGTLQTSINTVVTSANVAGGNSYRVTGLAGGTHTIEARATGQVAYLEGFMLYNGDETAGIRLWDAAASGSNSGYHSLVAAASKGTPNFIYAYDDWVKVQPALVTVMLGINDFYNSTSQTQTPAQDATSLAAVLANVRAACTSPPSIVLINQWERGPAGSTAGLASPWSAYVAQLYAVAATDGAVAVFDAQKRFPPGVQTSALNLINAADLTHNTDTGSGFLADAFVNWLLPR